MENQVKVSMICPIYNTDLDIIKRTIESVLAQTFNQYELLLIDDGSEKKIADGIDAIATMDERIRCVHIQNGGVSHARNIGIKESRGEYIAFVDDDDKISSFYLEEAYNLAIEYKVDVVYGTIKYSPDRPGNEQKKDNTVDVVNNIDDIKKCLLGYTRGNLRYEILGSPCGRLFRKEVVVNFDERMAFFEDQIFNREVINKCNRVVITNKQWYTYIQNPNSAMHKSSVESNLYFKIKDYWEKLAQLNALENEDVKHIATIGAIREYTRLIITGYLNIDATSDEIVEMMKEAAGNEYIYNAVKKTSIFDKECSLNDRIKLVFLKLHWYRLLLYLVKKNNKHLVCDRG